MFFLLGKSNSEISGLLGVHVEFLVAALPENMKSIWLLHSLTYNTVFLILNILAVHNNTASFLS